MKLISLRSAALAFFAVNALACGPDFDNASSNVATKQDELKQYTCQCTGGFIFTSTSSTGYTTGCQNHQGTCGTTTANPGRPPGDYI